MKVSERLRFEKPHVYVEVIKRPQYAVRRASPEEGVRSMPPPLSIVESCKYDFQSVIAAVLAMKYAFHVPTYREQQDWFAQWRLVPRPLDGERPDQLQRGDGRAFVPADVVPAALPADPSWATTRACGVLLRGQVVDDEQSAKLENRRRLRAATTLGATGPPGSATSYAWLYTGLDGMAPYNVFHWSLTHENCVIDEHSGSATTAASLWGDACGAITRRLEQPLGRADRALLPQRARAAGVRQGRVERSGPGIAGRSPSTGSCTKSEEPRQASGQSGTRGVAAARCASDLNRMRLWLDSEPVQASCCRRAAIGGAIGYFCATTGRALMVYLSDPRIPIDNDQSERAIRPLTVGRVNWLFLSRTPTSSALWAACGCSAS